MLIAAKATSADLATDAVVGSRFSLGRFRLLHEFPLGGVFGDCLAVDRSKLGAAVL